MENRASKGETRGRPAWLRALGRADPPTAVEVDGRPFRLVDTFKHDSWAATALYRDAQGMEITCKFNRLQPAGPVPLAWVGRWLAAREAAFLRRLHAVDGIPQDLGDVRVADAVLPNAIARRFIPGEPFRDGTAVDEAFFGALNAQVAAIHAAGIAYVDLHKRENIVIDTDGQPHLVDFQVAYGTPAGGGNAVARFLLSQLQEMDSYHLRKHYARCLGHTLSEADMEAFMQRPRLVRWHRSLSIPLRTLRRRLLTWLKVRDRSGQARSETDPEDAFRDTAAPRDDSSRSTR